VVGILEEWRVLYDTKLSIHVEGIFLPLDIGRVSNVVHDEVLDGKKSVQT
jgi:hypothetical protein